MLQKKANKKKTHAYDESKTMFYCYILSIAKRGFDRITFVMHSAFNSISIGLLLNVNFEWFVDTATAIFTLVLFKVCAIHVVYLYDER